MKAFSKVLCSLAVIGLPLLVIFIVFCVSNINIFDNPDFWYGYMAYFGTVSLALVSIWQTEKSYDISNRMLKIEEDRLLPFIEINREKSSICKINDTTLKVELCITNYSEYPVHNIYLSEDEVAENALEEMYEAGEIDNLIYSQLESLPSNKLNEKYILTAIACLREIKITHHKKTGNEFENLHNSEYLYFNIGMESIARPIALFMYMQNISQDVFKQVMKIYIVKRKDGEFVLTMHSKKISVIKHLVNK